MRIESPTSIPEERAVVYHQFGSIYCRSYHTILGEFNENAYVWEFYPLFWTTASLADVSWARQLMFFVPDDKIERMRRAVVEGNIREEIKVTYILNRDGSGYRYSMEGVPLVSTTEPEFTVAESELFQYLRDGRWFEARKLWVRMEKEERDHYPKWASKLMD
jgi:hypothetical protein